MNTVEWVQPNEAVVEMYRTAIGDHLVAMWEREQMALPDEDVEVVL
jgi:hypothetical protein